jgi:hypothetical protein
MLFVHRKLTHPDLDERDVARLVLRRQERA